LKVLVSTFGGDDPEKVLSAMRHIPYNRLVLVGEKGTERSEGFARLRDLEELAGHTIEVVHVECEDFLELVDSVAEVLVERTSEAGTKVTGTVTLNISGGSKILGDAALFAAFRVGVEAYHCDSSVTKLPVLKGASAKDMFTPAESRFLTSVGSDGARLDDIARYVRAASKQSVERTMRELKKAGLVTPELRNGTVFVKLSETGAEVARAIRACPSRD